ncbi:MAG TPA: DUF748 domain-containing protein, partial [Polyangia bacterium]|nr:DUF748 domain-containing protein [Polyangia bacterium]
MSILTAIARRRWLRRLLIGSASALALFAVVGFLVLPPVARAIAEKQLGQLLGRRVSVARVRVNPFALSLTVEGFQIYEPGGNTPFVGFGRLYVNAQLASIYRRAPVVKEVSLESLRVHVARLKATPDGWADPASYNFSDILARLAAMPRAPPAPPPAPDDGPARFSVNNIRISDAALTFDDRPLGSQHTISALNLGVPFVSTLPVFIDTFVEPGLRLTIDGTPFAFGGRTKPFKDSQETTVELRADRFDLTRYLPYVPVPLRFDVASALLDLALDVSFVRPRSDAPSLTVKGRVALEKVALREKNAAPLASLELFEVLIGKADVTAQAYAIDKVGVRGLDVHVRRKANGTLNLALLASAPAAATPPTPAPAPAKAVRKTAPASATAKTGTTAAPRFTVGVIDVGNVTVHFRDEAVHPAMEVAVDQLTVSVRGLSNAPQAKATVSASLRASPGGTLTHQGTLTLEPLLATGTLTVGGIEPGRFAPYFHDQITFDIARGRLRLGTGYHFRSAAAGPDLQLSGAFVELADLSLRKRGAKGGASTRPQDEFFRLHDLAIRNVDADLTRQTVVVGELTTSDGRVRAERNAAGVVDLTTLVPPAPPTTSARSAAISPPSPRAEPTPPAPAPAWSVHLTRFALDGWSARFEDHQVDPVAVTTLAPIKLTAGNVDTARGSRATLDLRLGLNKQGRIAVSGSASLDPVAANLKLDLRNIEILPLQPYFADQVNLTVTDGTVSVSANAKIEVPPAPPRGPPPPTRLAVSGDIDVARFAAVDALKQEPFLSWRSFHVGGLELTTAPLKVAVRELALTDFYSRLTIYPDAHFNVQDIAAAPKQAGPATVAPTTRPPPAAGHPTAQAQAQAQPPSPPPPVTIGQVTLQGGHVSFTDHLIRPNYSAELTELGGRLSGLSSDASTQADIDLRGAVDHSGALSIVGKINPLAGNLFVDIKVALKDFELPPASPYAAKYAGYGISKGKLALSLDYHIANKKLDAKNHVTIDQFTFGDKVKSPDATSLPVKLAVAILKDRHGVIDLNVPIAGSLDDPDFKIGRAVLKVLGNLIVKAVTAPFSLIASAFGGGDQLSRLDFPAGLAAVDAGAQAKIRTLAKALQERPGLSFEIEGGADPQRDREDLRRHIFQQKLHAQRVIELAKAGRTPGATPPAQDAATPIDAAERPHLV